MNTIINPRLDVFTYHHRAGLGASEEEIKANWENFWENFPDDYPSELKVSFEKEKNLDSTQYGKLLKVIDNSKTQIYLLPKIIQSGKIVEGFYCPVRLHDTYGLGFACGIDSAPDALPVEYFSYFKSLTPSKLLQHNKKFKYNYIGTTWMLSGSLPPNTDQKPEDLAKTICKEIGFDENLLQEQRDEIFEATVFELGRYPQREDYLENNHHVLIFIYPTPQKIDEISGKFYDDWMRLFSYRHKIIWAYWQSLQIIPWLQSNFFSLDKVRKNSAIRSLIIEQKKETEPTRQAYTLEQLQIALHDNSFTLYEYIRRLSILKIHFQTIETNIENHKKRLNIIQDKARKFGETRLESLNNFSDVVSQNFKSRIEKEVNSLEPGLSILQNLTDTLRGYVQIQQAEIDRSIEEQNRKIQSDLVKFSNKLAVVGVGIGAASAAASGSSAFMGEITKAWLVHFKKEPPSGGQASLSIILTLLFSLCIGRLASTLTHLLLKKVGRT